MKPINHRDASRREFLDQACVAATSVIAMGLGGLTPAAAAPQDPAPLPKGPEPDRRARIREQWEDVLLLEAIRYLDLSKAQVQAILPLAQAADERRLKLRGQEEKKLAALEPIVRQSREALLAGRAAEHEPDAVLHWQFLQQTRKQVEEEIIQYVAPRLARLLSRPQVLRAYLLTRGAALPAQVNSSALLDPGSGFVADETTKKQWRDAVVRQQLARLYPPQVLSIDPAAVMRQRSFDAEGKLVGPPMTGEEEAALQAGTRKMMLETDFEARWKDTSGGALAAATEDEQVWALYHFVWRMFRSSRIAPVLTERAG